MMKKNGAVVLVGCLMIVLTGCGNARTVATGGDRARFSSCYAIGFSERDVVDLYESAIADRANGFSYYEESRTAANACVDSCGVQTVCANGCTSCAYAVINVAYLKPLEELPAKNSADKDSAIRAMVRNLQPINH